MDQCRDDLHVSGVRIRQDMRISKIMYSNSHYRHYTLGLAPKFFEQASLGFEEKERGPVVLRIQKPPALAVLRKIMCVCVASSQSLDNMDSNIKPFHTRRKEGAKLRKPVMKEADERCRRVLGEYLQGSLTLQCVAHSVVFLGTYQPDFDSQAESWTRAELRGLRASPNARKWQN